MAGSRLGVGVAAVTEEVDVDLGHANLLGHLEQAEQVVDVRVDTAVRDQTEQMQAAVALLCAGEALDDVVDLVELALLDGLVDAHNVLPDDTAGANVQVTDLAVAHEAFGETDGERRGLELSVALGDLAALFGELVHPGSVGIEDGVALVGRILAGDTPSVNADEDCFLCDLCHVDVWLTNCNGDTGSVEAAEVMRGFVFRMSLGHLTSLFGPHFSLTASR